MRNLWLLICASLLLTACSGGQVTERWSSRNYNSASSKRLELKADGKDSVLDVKSGVMFAMTENHTYREYGAAAYRFFLANYDLKRSEGLYRLLSNGEMLVGFQLFGDPGSDKNTPIKVGTYRPDVQEFPKYNPGSLTITSYEDGKQSTAFSRNTPGIETKGEVKIISVEGDTVKGEINITTSNGFAAKGNFTVKDKTRGFKSTGN
jgi:hypothetical protein